MLKITRKTISVCFLFPIGNPDVSYFVESVPKNRKPNQEDRLFQAGQSKPRGNSIMMRACETIGMIKMRAGLFPEVLTQTTPPRRTEGPLCDL